MDYEIAYIEILEKLRKFLDCWRNYPPDNNSYEDVIDDLEYRFPELKESEDERIKKEIIGFLNAINKDQLEARNFIADRYGDAIPDDMIPTWISWLEKQGEQNLANSAKTCKDEPKFKAGDVVRHKNGNTITITGVDKKERCYYYTAYDGAATLHSDFGFGEECNWELKEQNPADKVEPKFKVGDWIVCCDYEPFQIIGIKNDMYKMSNGDIRPFYMVDNNHNIRLWTIEDAKNGDVLFYKGNVNNSNGITYERICIFNNLNNAFFTLTKYSNYIEEYAIDVNIDYPDNTVPATKEQKEILFMIMKKAGYEWDSKKKELKEIEQNHAWSEDEKPLLEKFKQAVYDCAWGKVTCKAEGETKEEYANRWAEHFLLMVRDWADDYIDYAIQQKLRKSYDKGKEDAIKTNSPAWSEEDEHRITDTIYFLETAKKHYASTEELDACIEYLKSIKERVQSKQDLHPRYIEGKGIYVPIIDVVLNMQDESEKMTWEKAKAIALSKEQMFIVLYYKDEINALLEKHGGQELEGWHWTSTQYSGDTYAWSVNFYYSYVTNLTRTNGYSVRAFSAYHPES